MAIIHTAGLKPALSYGSAVFGMSDCELKRARATLLSFKSPSHRGASLVAKCVLHGDPVADAAIAPAVQWAVAIWQPAAASLEIIAEGSQVPEGQGAEHHGRGAAEDPLGECEWEDAEADAGAEAQADAEAAAEEDAEEGAREAAEAADPELQAAAEAMILEADAEDCGELCVNFFDTEGQGPEVVRRWDLL
ncbi:unnamed protein product [Prorocentrum cordatum]|uniref:Uncharacterized protein n=1 Tax=Prorocentrum cordatum TaxID=2364126 RepID=A0ABN9QUJ6_9DINO|nr:unnamed protein product [Polarella glacialis]